MSDYDRNRFYPKKKFFSTRESSNSYGRSFFGNKSEGNTTSKSSKESREYSSSDLTMKKQPTILLKTREPTAEDVGASPKRSHKEDVNTNITIVSSAKEPEPPSVPIVKNMVKSMKLIEDGVICTEILQDYFQENNEFLVIGVVGLQGVGKSTVLNLLAHNCITPELKKSIFKLDKKDFDDDYMSDNIKILTEHMEKIDLKNEMIVEKEIFKIEKLEDIESGSNKTQGIDIYITSNRLILLDCQPFGSVPILEDLIKSENKRTNLVSEFIPLENSGEIQSLQLTTFLMSVCHVLLLVQDWFFDSNVIRFLHSAEMLKPTIPNPEDELTDHFPHLMIIHNRTQMDDFNPSKFKEIQKNYHIFLNRTKLNKTDMSSAMRKMMKCFEDTSVDPINIFLLPEVDLENDDFYTGHPPLENMVKRLRAEILGVTRNPLTHVPLSEKTWLIYCSKVWDTVKKSSFFVEYTKLMP